ncbi:MULTISPECIES: hypothetical protein [unclassified Helicobacter]|nr:MULTISPECIES: hypothetical protein [unclassified Helicobacter]
MITLFFVLFLYHCRNFCTYDLRNIKFLDSAKSLDSAKPNRVADSTKTLS